MNFSERFLVWIKGYKKLGALSIGVLMAFLQEVLLLDFQTLALIESLLMVFIGSQAYADSSGYSPVKKEK